jgi:hypothetical protein
MKRRGGLSAEEFREYYNDSHLPFLATVLPSVKDKLLLHRRNFLAADDPILDILPQGRVDREATLDAITELYFQSREDAVAVLREFSDPANLDRIEADERRFVSPESIRFYVVDIVESPEDTAVGL